MIDERKLTGGEKRSKEAKFKKLKKHKDDFKKRYGKDAESVMHAVATKQAKKEDIQEKENRRPAKFKTNPELLVIRGINGMHSKQGSITRSQQTLRDEIANPYYKKLEKEVAELKRTSPAYTMRNEGVISDLFKASTAEKRAKDQMGSAYDAMRLEKETKKFAKQGLSPEDARKYAYRKVYGAPVRESKLPMGKIHKAVDDGKSMDAIVGMFANKGTTNTNDIRKAVKDYKFKSRMKK